MKQGSKTMMIFIDFFFNVAQKRLKFFDQNYLVFISLPVN